MDRYITLVPADSLSDWHEPDTEWTPGVGDTVWVQGKVTEDQNQYGHYVVILDDGITPAGHVAERLALHPAPVAAPAEALVPDGYICHYHDGGNSELPGDTMDNSFERADKMSRKKQETVGVWAVRYVGGVETEVVTRRIKRKGGKP